MLALQDKNGGGNLDKNFLEQTVETVWDEGLTCPDDVLHAVMEGLDQGIFRAAEPLKGHWQVNAWIKKAILLYFRSKCSKVTDTSLSPFYDKISLKCQGWDVLDFRQHGFRLAPGSIVRQGVFLAPDVVVMPSFINVGAFIDSGTMIDAHASVGSCAQIGKNCHISAGVIIGGVLEPLQAQPVIVENGCFIGAGSTLAEGVLVEEGAVLGMGVFLGAGTKIVNRQTGDISYGRIPPYAVVVPGSLACETNPNLSVNCAVIVKHVDHQTRSKVAINDLLRTF